MVNRRLIVFKILAVTTVLIIFVSLYYPRGDHDRQRNGAIHRYPSSVRFPISYTNVNHGWPPGTVTSEPALAELLRPPLSSAKETKGYLLALYVLEQLTMSSSHYQNLINIAHSWGLSCVEPTICHSRMYGLPGISGACHQQDNSSNWQKNTVEVKYGRLFNLSYLNNKLVECLNISQLEHNYYNSRSPFTTIIESVDEFIQFSHRDLVLVHFINGIGGSASRMSFLPQDKMRYFERAVLASSIRDPIVDCTQEAKHYGITSAVEQVLNKTTGVSVFVVRCVVCINKAQTKYGIDITQLKNSIYRSLPNVSVVFTKWQNRGIFDPESGQLSSCKVSPIPHSNEIESTTKQFLSMMDVNIPFIAVHLRLERLYQCEAIIPGYTKCCVKRISSLLKKVQQKYDINTKDVLIIKDYGPYGTDSCSYKLKYMNVSFCLNLSRDFFSELQKYGYRASEFIPRDYASNVPDNSGFVSLVEAGAILSGSVLVTSGFGSYQGTIIKQFLGISDPNVGFKHFDDKHSFGSTVLYERLYRVCTCSPLKGHSEKLNGINLGRQSCDSEGFN